MAQRPQPLVMRDITKRWRGRTDPVLADLNLELEGGSLAWIGGDNGAGKTTLLRLACGLLEPDRGAVSVCGFDLHREPAESKRRVGVLMAGNSGLWARLTVLQQLALWARLALVAPDDRVEAVDGAIARFGLTGFERRRLDRISMGERQRVRLAMCFLHGPDLVLLDEPRNSLDLGGLELLRAAVADLRGRGGAAVWCAPTGEEPDPDLTVRLQVGGGQVAPA